MAALRDLTPSVEEYSIDEAFLEADDGDEALGLAHGLRKKVDRWTGLPISVGVGATEVLAKAANLVAKRSAGGVFTLTEENADELLDSLPVGEVWGVGRQYGKALRSRGIMSALQLRNLDVRRARRLMTVVGARVVEELRGRSCLPLEIVPPERKSLCCSRTFGRAVETLAELREAVATFTVGACEKLRRHGLAAAAVSVWISTNPFTLDEPHYSNSATVALAFPTDSTHELLGVTLAACEGLFRSGRRYKKAGVMFSGLIPSSPITRRMFDDERGQKLRRVSAAVDAINRRYGREAVRFAAAGAGGGWRPRAERRSPRYTTNWDELVRVG